MFLSLSLCIHIFFEHLFIAYWLNPNAPTLWGSSGHAIDTCWRPQRGWEVQWPCWPKDPKKTWWFTASPLQEKEDHPSIPRCLWSQKIATPSFLKVWMHMSLFRCFPWVWSLIWWVRQTAPTHGKDDQVGKGSVCPSLSMILTCFPNFGLSIVCFITMCHVFRHYPSFARWGLQRNEGAQCRGHLQGVTLLEGMWPTCVWLWVHAIDGDWKTKVWNTWNGCQKGRDALPLWF